MHVVEHYACDICNHSFEKPTEAQRCEAAGCPKAVSWLPFGEKIPVFSWHQGEWAIVDSILVWNEWETPGEHQWLANFRVSIRGGPWTASNIKVKSLDPREMHWMYETPDGSDRTEFQQKWLKRYGLG